MMIYSVVSPFNQFMGLVCGTKTQCRISDKLRQMIKNKPEGDTKNTPH